MSRINKKLRNGLDAFFMKKTSTASKKNTGKRKVHRCKPVNALDCLSEEERHLAIVEVLAGLLECRNEEDWANRHVKH